MEVDYQQRTRTATEGTDYTRADRTTLIFEAGQTQTTIEVQTTPDELDEANEEFSVELSNPNGAALSRGTGTGTIIDGDVPPELSIGDAGADEGDVATFNVRLNRASGKTVTVSYATADGTAEAPMDYAATSGTLKFLAGEQSKPISVPIRDDAIDEPVETFTVTLRNPTDATLDDGTATGTITDGDNPPELSIDDDTGGDDTGDDGNNNGNNGNTGGNNHNTNIDDGTDLNNGGEDEDELRDVGDPGLPKISIADTTVEEGDTARFVVTLSPASDQTVTVRYKTADGTADEGTDYRGVSRTLTFAPGNTRQSIAVPTRDDALDEPQRDVPA